jgi:fructose-1,6-bisphosphatase/inositol monophosphatase family enzyme
MSEARHLLEPIIALHERIRDSVIEACERQSTEQLASVAAEESSDTIYRIDRVSEDVLVAGLEIVARHDPLVLVAEGIGQGKRVLPEGTSEADCRWRVIVDPIDGTREIMYQKRSAWVLTGVAPNLGDETRIRHIELAVQTEIPVLKQHLCDQLWAERGRGTTAVRVDRVKGTRTPLVLRASRAPTLAHGFASVSRFFPGVRDVLAAIDDEIVLEVLGPPDPHKATCFEDQYLSTGGQFYELMAGRDRFIADIRPLLASVVASRGLPPSLCCHPYDICTALIAQECGVFITAPNGEPIDAPFDVDADVAWIGYANESIRQRVEPALNAALARRGLLPALAARS